ncbi:MAG: (2Fe-2S)-binding protein [Candidatus Sumerlaeaceae bacterium]|nr:(2Fe-2S)-binding protein [Candidatus Sumerlaeaceae bacterium]
MTDSNSGDKPGGGLSRRGFLKGVGAGTLAATAGAGLAARATGAQPTTPAAVDAKILRGTVPVTLKINGKPRTLTVETRTTLLEALRAHLDLTGTKLVCDRATCGACTVLLDGRAVTACMILALDAQGCDIQTIEGLAAGDALHPIQQAFLECDALQCGFCTPGFIMATKALLDANPAPTPDEVRAALSGNICRCGTYNHIFDAVEKAKVRLAGGDATP